MLQPSPMRGQVLSCRRQNRAQQHAHPNANSLGASSVPSLSEGLPHNQHIYRAHYRVLPSPCADTTQLKLRSYSQSWLQVPEAVLKETSRFSQLRRPVPRGLRPLQLLGLLPSPVPPRQGSLGRWGPLAAGRIRSGSRTRGALGQHLAKLGPRGVSAPRRALHCAGCSSAPQVARPGSPRARACCCGLPLLCRSSPVIITCTERQ